MAWLQLRVLSAHPEFAEEVLLAHGAQAVTFADAADDPVFEPKPGEMPLWQSTLAIGLFAQDTDLAPAKSALRELLPDGDMAQFKTELLEDRDWVRVWLDSWQPMKFGDRLWVVPHAKLGEVTDPQAVILKLDPGLAFGTGTHPTTALCLEWLTHQELKGKTVLDYGCGSGILAIAALLLGAEKAICVDIDPQALTATQQNAQANGLSGRVKTLLPEEFIPFPADVVIANILSGPLVQLAPLLSSSSRPRGLLALSGLLERQAAEVRATYERWFTLDTDRMKEGWTLVSGRCHLPGIINLLKISDQLLTAGQPRVEHFPALAKMGITDVVNLTPADSSGTLTDEAGLCARNGMRYRHIPVQWKNPTKDNLLDFMGEMDAFGSAPDGRRLLVHCVMNKRVSVFVFLWRVLRRKENPENALQDLRRIWQPDEVWQAFLEENFQQKV